MYIKAISLVAAVGSAFLFPVSAAPVECKPGNQLVTVKTVTSNPAPLGWMTVKYTVNATKAEIDAPYTPAEVKAKKLAPGAVICMVDAESEQSDLLHGCMARAAHCSP